MQYSFYGGPPGQSFKVSKVFNNKVELQEDLSARWSSTIGIGEYVFISYGMADTEDSDYQNNLSIDKAMYGKNYNTTLWQKIYTEDGDDSSDEYSGLEHFYAASAMWGLGYKLIAVLTGSSPSITIKAEAENADYTLMEVDEDKSDLNSPIFTIHLPQSQILKYDPETDFTATKADTEPTFKLDSSNINEPEIKVTMPRSQVLQYDETSEDCFKVTAAGTVPTFKLDRSDVDKPVIRVTLPQSQTIQYNVDDNFTVLNADEEPTFTIKSDTDINNPVINVAMPQSQVLLSENVTTEVVGPSELPSLTVDTSTDELINRPTAVLKLPRSATFTYGDLLGKQTDGTYTLAKTSTGISELSVGDYYINKETGFIYEVTGEDDSNLTFTFRACFDPPKPGSVTTNSLTAYTLVGTTYSPTAPTVTSSYLDDSEKIGWQLIFGLPTEPTFAATAETVGSLEDAAVTAEITGANEYTYNFSIPRGSRTFTGTEVDSNNNKTSIDGAEAGDVYINTDFGNAYDGYVYQLDSDGKWIQTGSIKGSTGNPLNILTTVEISSTQVDTDTLAAVSSYLQDTLGLSPSNNDVIAVNYSTSDATTAYWYYCIDGTWARSQLTGGVENLVQNEWTGSNLTGKAYSVNLINNMLVKDENTSTGDGNNTVYTVAKVDSMLSDLVVDTDETATDESSQTYSIAQINELLQDASMKWGRWSSGKLYDADGNEID